MRNAFGARALAPPVQERMAMLLKALLWFMMSSPFFVLLLSSPMKIRLPSGGICAKQNVYDSRRY
jgi:hypothetical protein